MAKVKVLLDTKTYGRKPMQDKVEWKWIDKETKQGKVMYEPGAVNTRLIKNPVEIDFKELMQACLKGHTWSLADFNKKEGSNKISRTKECWKSQQIFALDIDNGLTPEAALERCMKLGLEPTYIYSSYSDSSKLRKFRIVFLSDVVVTDYRDAYTTTMALMMLFPEADVQCKDCNRFYYGGKEELYENYEASINPQRVVQAYITYHCIKEPKVYKRKIKELAKKTGLSLENGLPKEIKCAKVGSSIIYNIEQHGFAHYEYDFSEDVIRHNAHERKSSQNICSQRDYVYEVTDVKVKKELIEKFDFKELEEKCPLWGGFASGDIYPFDNEFMGISLNMLKLKGGEVRLKRALFKTKGMPESVKELYTEKIKYYKNYTNAENCQNFCPKYMPARERIDSDAVEQCYDCECTGYKMLHAVAPKRNSIRQISTPAFRELEHVFNDTERAIRNVLSRMPDINKVFVIKSPPGIGKSLMLRIIAEECPELFNNTIIAAPTHDLLHEFVPKFDNILPNYIHITEPIIQNKSYEAKYKAYMSTAQYSAAKGVLKAYMKELVDKTEEGSAARETANKYIEQIKNYLKAIEDAKNTNMPIFCTHKRLLNLRNSNVEKYVIDEDIVSTLVKTIVITKEMLNDISEAAVVAMRKDIPLLNEQFLNMLKFFKNLENSNTANQIIEVPKTLCSIEFKDMKKVIDECNPSNNLIELLDIKAAYKANNGIITAYIHNRLPNKPIIILSATANEAVYKALMPNRTVEFIDLGNAYSTGDIVMHYKGMSRNYLNNNFDKALEILKEKAPGVTNIITYKSYESKFKEHGYNPICHFGKCTGIDNYKGQDLIVFGTPHVNMGTYLILAHACGLRDIRIDEGLEFVNIKRNGYEFSFSTFNNRLLCEIGDFIREIQYYIIESELQQAVGRARILREDCTVHLFSNYPLPGVKLL